MRPAVRSSRKTPEQQSFSLCSDLWHLKICFSPLSTTFCVCTRTFVCVCRQGKGCVFLGTARGRKYAATGGHTEMIKCCGNSDRNVENFSHLQKPLQTAVNLYARLGFPTCPSLHVGTALFPFAKEVWLVNVIILRRTKRQQKVKFSQPLLKL